MNDREKRNRYSSDRSFIPPFLPAAASILRWWWNFHPPHYAKHKFALMLLLSPIRDGGANEECTVNSSHIAIDQPAAFIPQTTPFTTLTPTSENSGRLWLMIYPVPPNSRFSSLRSCFRCCSATYFPLMSSKCLMRPTLQKPHSLLVVLWMACG